MTVDNDLCDRERSETNPVVYLNVPYIGKKSKRFIGQLAKLFHVKFDVKLSAIYKTFKAGTYFQLKSRSAQMSFTNLHVCVIRT